MTPRNENNLDEDKALVDNFWKSQEKGTGKISQLNTMNVNKDSPKKKDSYQECEEPIQEDASFISFTDSKNEDKELENEIEEKVKKDKFEKKCKENKYYVALVSKFMSSRETIGLKEKSSKEISEILKINVKEKKEIDFEFFKKLIFYIKNEESEEENEENLEELFKIIDRYSEGKSNYQKQQTF